MVEVSYIENSKLRLLYGSEHGKRWVKYLGMGQKNPWIWGRFGTAVLPTKKNSFYGSASKNGRTTQYSSPSQPTSSTRGGGRGGSLRARRQMAQTRPSGPPWLPWQKLVPLGRQGAAVSVGGTAASRASLWGSGVHQRKPQPHPFGANSRKTTRFHVVLPSTISQAWLADLIRTGVARLLLFFVSSGLRFLLQILLHICRKFCSPVCTKREGEKATGREREKQIE